MAKLLAVVALCKTCLGSPSLNLDDDIAEAGQFEYFQGFLTSGGVTRMTG
jgi:hypothetical protein